MKLISSFNVLKNIKQTLKPSAPVVLHDSYCIEGKKEDVELVRKHLLKDKILSNGKSLSSSYAEFLEYVVPKTERSKSNYQHIIAFKRGWKLLNEIAAITEANSRARLKAMNALEVPPDKKIKATDLMAAVPLDQKHLYMSNQQKLPFNQ